MDVQLTLAGIRVPIRTAHRLSRGHALGGAHTAPSLSLTQSSKAALPTAVTGSSASHPDLPSKGAGRGFQFTCAAICDTITATHRIIDARTHLLAHALSLPILHGTCCPKRTPHPKARGQGLVTRALVLGGNGALLPTLSLLTPAVIIIRVPVVSTHGSISPITDDTVTGAAGAASAGQTHSIEPAHIWTLVLRLALARAHFLEDKATGGSRAAHYAVVVIGDSIIPAHRCWLRRATLWPEEHLRMPRAWVNAADTAQVMVGALAGVTRAVKLLDDVLLASAREAQELALTGVVSTVAPTHGALRGPPAGGRAQACGCLPIC